MDTKQIKDLLQKQQSGQLTDEEKAILDTWYLKLSQTETVDVNETDTTRRLDAVWAILEVNKRLKRDTFRLNIIRISSAAAIILITSGALFYALKKDSTPQIASQLVKNDIAPGSNKATLTLANGKQIILTGAQNGQIAIQGNTAINKTADGEVSYNAGQAVAPAESRVAFNTMAAPRGGQYHLTLADGTNVWLNAASSIKYPIAFTGNDRQVEITGEVYFEVAHNAAKPFRVTSNGQTVEVLGTHFNINAYDDEAVIKTTLLEGRVKIISGNKNAILKPGQQSSITSANNFISVKNVDVDQATAWKDGFFQYDHANIQVVMRQLSRWYDVSVKYEGKTTTSKFGGSIQRNLKLSQVLAILEKSQVHFRIEGKEVIVMP